MLKRQIVKIDEEKCTGCGLCVPSCAEGALQIIDGKARLVKEIYCDGLGACLGDCPEDAITIEEREAEAFDEAAVVEHLERSKHASPPPSPQAAPPTGGCPGAAMRKFNAAAVPTPTGAKASLEPVGSALGHWPVQLHLLPPQGDIWNDADVLIAADCVPFAMPDFHRRLLSGKTLAIGCPKLDDVSAYVEKLTAVFTHNTIRSITVAHMEVPCCSGILIAAKQALQQSSRTDITFHDITVGIKGEIISES